jgi:hypothetical protein
MDQIITTTATTTTTNDTSSSNRQCCRSDPTCRAICQAARYSWLYGNSSDNINSNNDGCTRNHPDNNGTNNHTEIQRIVGQKMSCHSNNHPTVTMAQVESMYRMVLDRSCCCCIKKDPNNGCGSPADDDDSPQRDAQEKLALILLQSGRHPEADTILASMNFTCRLSSQLFHYANAVSSRPLAKMAMKHNDDERNHGKNAGCYCKVYDDFLHQEELQVLQTVFCDIHGSYWTDHFYSVEPPSPYYSYILPLHNSTMDEHHRGSLLYALIHRLQGLLLQGGPFPALQTATCAEVWAHNRPHATGHQFHFDSDNEGCTDVIRNPIVSCVLYLSPSSSRMEDNNNNTVGSGGPTVVTNQRLSSRGLASKAWIVPATKSNRLVAFDGKLLHGVVPGMSDTTTATNQRRVSLMVAFWKTIRVRQSPGSAACQWPTPGTRQWADTLMMMAAQPSSRNRSREPCEVTPITISPVYETVPGGQPWSSRLGVPDYESMFQGM